MSRKYMFAMLIICMFACVTSMNEKVEAATMNSKAGITFSNSYNPDITDDTNIPDGSIVVDKISDDRIFKKILPKTGGNHSILIQYIGLGIILVALAILANLFSNQVMNRNKKISINK